ncbi:hypothetical protein X975_16785, partial [Stegodyphus mimosarum]
MSGENTIFDLPAAYFFLGLLFLLSSILFSCFAIRHFCRWLATRSRRQSMKHLVPEQTFYLPEDDPPPYDSLLPSYDEAARMFSQQVTVDFSNTTDSYCSDQRPNAAHQI